MPADEGQHLQTVYPTAQAYGGPGPVRLRRSGASDRDSSELVSPAERGAAARRAGSRHWDLDEAGSRREVAAEPDQDALPAGALPRRAFVVVVRHPIAVSLATQKWSQTSASLARSSTGSSATRRFADDRPQPRARARRALRGARRRRRRRASTASAAFLGLEPHPVSETLAEPTQRRVLRAVARSSGRDRSAVLASGASSGVSSADVEPLRLQPRGPRARSPRASPRRAITVSRT